MQGSIRAQLADCLVAVVCQQLEFVDAYGLLAPRCEVLTASSGAKGTIRAGQFSQIANVLQSGGDDGMWTFDRYQRWMQQKRDWVRPAAAAAAPAVQRRSPVEITIDDDLDLAEIAKKVDDSVRRR
jgi:twitching motility protein PilT